MSHPRLKERTYSSYAYVGREVNMVNDNRRSWAGGKERLGSF